MKNGTKYHQNGMEHHQQEKHVKVAIISSSNAVIEPGTMVVHTLYQGDESR